MKRKLIKRIQRKKEWNKNILQHISVIDADCDLEEARKIVAEMQKKQQRIETLTDSLLEYLNHKRFCLIMKDPFILSRMNRIDKLQKIIMGKI